MTLVNVHPEQWWFDWNPVKKTWVWCCHWSLEKLLDYCSQVQVQTVFGNPVLQKSLWEDSNSQPFSAECHSKAGRVLTVVCCLQRGDILWICCIRFRLEEFQSDLHLFSMFVDLVNLRHHSSVPRVLNLLSDCRINKVVSNLTCFFQTKLVFLQFYFGLNKKRY